MKGVFLLGQPHLHTQEKQNFDAFSLQPQKQPAHPLRRTTVQIFDNPNRSGSASSHTTHTNKRTPSLDLNYTPSTSTLSQPQPIVQQFRQNPHQLRIPSGFPLQQQSQQQRYPQLNQQQQQSIIIPQPTQNRLKQNEQYPSHAVPQFYSSLQDNSYMQSCNNNTSNINNYNYHSDNINQRKQQPRESQEFQRNQHLQNSNNNQHNPNTITTATTQNNKRIFSQPPRSHSISASASFADTFHSVNTLPQDVINPIPVSPLNPKFNSRLSPPHSQQHQQKHPNHIQQHAIPNINGQGSPNSQLRQRSLSRDRIPSSDQQQFSFQQPQHNPANVAVTTPNVINQRQSQQNLDQPPNIIPTKYIQQQYHQQHSQQQQIHDSLFEGTSTTSGNILNANKNRSRSQSHHASYSMNRSSDEPSTDISHNLDNSIRQIVPSKFIQEPIPLLDPPQEMQYIFQKQDNNSLKQYHEQQNKKQDCDPNKLNNNVNINHSFDQSIQNYVLESLPQMDIILSTTGNNNTQPACHASQSNRNIENKSNNHQEQKTVINAVTTEKLSREIADMKLEHARLITSFDQLKIHSQEYQQQKESSKNIPVALGDPDLQCQLAEIQSQLAKLVSSGFMQTIQSTSKEMENLKQTQQEFLQKNQHQQQQQQINEYNQKEGFKCEDKSHEYLIRVNSDYLQQIRLLNESIQENLTTLAEIQNEHKQREQQFKTQEHKLKKQVLELTEQLQLREVDYNTLSTINESVKRENNSLDQQLQRLLAEKEITRSSNFVAQEEFLLCSNSLEEHKAMCTQLQVESLTRNEENRLLSIRCSDLEKQCEQYSKDAELKNEELIQLLTQLKKYELTIQAISNKENNQNSINLSYSDDGIHQKQKQTSQKPQQSILTHQQQQINNINASICLGKANTQNLKGPCSSNEGYTTEIVMLRQKVHEKQKEIEHLRSQVNCSVHLESVVNEFKIKLQAVLAENQRLNMILFERCKNSQWA